MNRMTFAVIASLLLASACMALDPQQNTANVKLHQSPGNDFRDFNWTVGSYSDQKFRLNFDHSIAGLSCEFKMSRYAEGNTNRITYVYVRPAAITVSTTSAWFTVAYTNIPPVFTYMGELFGTDSATSNHFNLARGHVTVSLSLYGPGDTYNLPTNHGGYVAVEVDPKWTAASNSVEADISSRVKTILPGVASGSTAQVVRVGSTVTFKVPAQGTASNAPTIAQWQGSNAVLQAGINARATKTSVATVGTVASNAAPKSALATVGSVASNAVSSVVAGAQSGSTGYCTRAGAAVAVHFPAPGSGGITGATATNIAQNVASAGYLPLAAVPPTSMGRILYSSDTGGKLTFWGPNPVAGDAFLSGNQTFTGTNVFAKTIRGSVTNSDRLGNQLPAYYAKASALTTVGGLASNALPKAGGTLTGNLNLGSSTLQNGDISLGTLHGITAGDGVFDIMLGIDGGPTLYLGKMDGAGTVLTNWASVWATAYHGSGAALTGVVHAEVDPKWAAVSNATATGVSHGNTAYGWGNHASAGYAYPSITNGIKKVVCVGAGVSGVTNGQSVIYTIAGGGAGSYLPLAGGNMTGGATNTSARGWVGNGANITNAPGSVIAFLHVTDGWGADKAAGDVLMNYSNVVYDTKSMWTPSAARMIPPVGYVRVRLSVQISSVAQGYQSYMYITKNGTTMGYYDINAIGTSYKATLYGYEEFYNSVATNQYVFKAYIYQGAFVHAQPNYNKITVEVVKP